MKKLAAALAALVLISTSVNVAALSPQSFSPSFEVLTAAQKKAAKEKEKAGAGASSAASEDAPDWESSKAAAQEAPGQETTAQDAVESEIPVIEGKNFQEKVEESIIKKINKERAELGLGKLTYDVNLRSAARIRSQELYKAGPRKFSHKRPNGDDWNTVLKEDIPVQYQSAGENLSMTEYNDPRSRSATSATFWYNEWANSPTHYENMVRPEFTHVGVGIYVVERNGMTYGYATTIFAKE